MNIKKVAIMGGIVTMVGLTSLLGINLASAQSDSSRTGNLIDKIAQKFNLNKSEVQAVFDEDKAARAAEMQAKQKERLDQAVKDGKLSQEQEDKIIAKLAELKAQRDAEGDSLKDKTEAERHTLKDQRRTELEQWAKANSIPLEYLRLGGHKRPGHAVKPDSPSA
ncbi:MAG TPA: hypothetical protein VM124_01045 [Candidatus Limnocylindrales bacterium]|nr:hypothetical protein [Candidatus Limnocylindrales bacterium]